ncbi:unnamed protein product [Blepharisma stoltei]|uniref:Transmembrane protein n=1 Tax=Blepharisma stoltei TaxID=1481888 RepID=A0AAU9IMV9_9CILI|nr:unnamed protein product [Blepharisma stoltei]
MTELYFALGCTSMCASLVTASYGYHGGMNYEQKKKWEKAVRYQQLGSIPLLFVGNKKNKHIPGALSAAGVSLFCLPLYYYAKTEDSKFNFAMPWGGVLMMASWLTLGFLA